MTLQRLATALAVLIAVAVTLVCTALSPYALAAAGDSMRLDWNTLADVGESYGATSALVSALALAAVAASITYQVRAVRQQRLQTFRDQVREMSMLLVSDPETYAPASMQERAGMDPVELRRDVYAQMWLQLYASAYESGYYDEAFMRSPDGAAVLLGTESRRRHWERHRHFWLSNSIPALRRFGQLVDDCYHKVPAAGPLPAPEPWQPANADNPGRRIAVERLAAGAAILVAVGWLVGRHRGGR